MKRRRTNRPRRDSVVPNKGMPLLPRTIQKFRREVVALLIVGHGWSAERATRAVVKWDKYVRARWREAKPPCAVADHISRWTKEGAVCPCGDGTGRDCSVHRRRRRSSRDADNPKPGEVYEARSGKRWRVDEVTPTGKLRISSAGLKDTGKMTWGKGSLVSMKQIEGARGEGQLKLPFLSDARDPSSRRRMKSAKSTKKGGTFIQSLLLSKTVFKSVGAAKAWAKKAGFRYGRVEAMKNNFRVVQAPMTRSMRIVATKPLKRGVQMVIGVHAKTKAKRR